MYKYRDTDEFHEKYPTKDEKERVLATLSDEEIWHLAKTCTNKTGAAWYAKHMKDKNFRGKE